MADKQMHPAPAIHHVARIVVFILLGTLFSGCSVINLAAMRMQPRDQFIPAAANLNVRYYAGSEGLAERMVKAVPDSIATVERRHGVPFKQAPKMYVCDTKCFVRFAPFNQHTPAAHFADSIFMHDDVLRSRELKHNMPPERFLTHELSHLLLYQYLGPIGYMQVPAWFREGLAVSVSGGAGAEGATPRDAALSILAGKSFDAAEAGSVFRNRTSATYGLRSSIFYRQAGMFVDYLREADPAAFQQSLLNILEGAAFQQSFYLAYGKPVASLWEGFVEHLISTVVVVK
jgi:hypothetical protein